MGEGGGETISSAEKVARGPCKSRCLCSAGCNFWPEAASVKCIESVSIYLPSTPLYSFSGNLRLICQLVAHSYVSFNIQCFYSLLQGKTHLGIIKTCIRVCDLTGTTAALADLIHISQFFRPKNPAETYIRGLEERKKRERPKLDLDFQRTFFCVGRGHQLCRLPS